MIENVSFEISRLQNIKAFEYRHILSSVNRTTKNKTLLSIHSLGIFSLNKTNKTAASRV